jgi:hypothetical protein
MMVFILASPLAGTHAFSHSGHAATNMAVNAHDHGAKTTCKQTCDEERSHPCCADMLSHCSAFATEMKFCSFTSPVLGLKAWRFGPNAEFGGLRSEAETPPPRT